MFTCWEQKSPDCNSHRDVTDFIWLNKVMNFFILTLFFPYLVTFFQEIIKMSLGTKKLVVPKQTLRARESDASARILPKVPESEAIAVSQESNLPKYEGNAIITLIDGFVEGLFESSSRVEFF